MTCPHCGESAKFVNYRSKGFVSLVGDIQVPRAYYHCDHCHQGAIPWETTLRLTERRLTPAAEEVVTMAGTLDSFAQAAKRTLDKMAGLRLSESTVERATEAAGERLEHQLEAGKVPGGKQSWDWNTDADGHTCAYVSLDATGILMQGPEGAKADGRMVWVGMVYNPEPRADTDTALAKPCENVRYLAGLYPLPELGKQLRRQGGHVGMDAADRWIALTDGGNGLEEFIDAHFPGSVKILDFQHAAGHLAELAEKLRSAEMDQTLLTSWCHTLKYEGGRRLLAILEELDRRRMSHAARTTHEKVCNYIRNNKHRMNYPAYLRHGWQIATGAVESACKTVVNQRLSQGGMRWSEAGANAVAHLRALYRSEPAQWNAFWNYATAA